MVQNTQLKQALKLLQNYKRVFKRIIKEYLKNNFQQGNMFKERKRTQDRYKNTRKKKNT